MGFVLKVSCEDSVLRKRYSSASEVTFQEIDESINAFFGLRGYTATYQGKDGEWRAFLTQSDLDDALAAGGPKALLRLHVARATEEEHPIETASLEESLGESLADTQCEDGSFVIPENVPTFALDTPVHSPVHSPRQAHSPEDDLLSHAVSDREESLETEGSEEGSTPDTEAREPSSEEVDQERAVLTPEEKVQIILAAFDENEDGCLDYKESISLQTAASTKHISKKEYKSLCHQLGQDENVGFDIEALLNLYEVYGTLDGDFDAALRKLGKQSEQQAGCGKGHCHKPCRISPFLALPAALALGPLAGAAVLALSHCSRK